ncbi:MAG: thiamine phosphate synthase [Nitrospinae bacterium]|jgi:thiamine-phosphate pyrophosphorylase|nr:thiamine phosphate synthase [Nitrospinota bacterium]MDA1109578.1 thiamine phosphate synthase [Nitrospinota bacterium]
MHPLDDLKVYLITQRSCFSEHDFLPCLELALEGGVRAVQLREKDLSTEELLKLAQKVKLATEKYGAKLFINERADIAHQTGAEGVHLTEASAPVEKVRKNFPNLLIGVSTHSLESARQAELGGADFITFSPIYETPSKKEFGPPQGLDRLQEVCREIKIPVLALGGISKDRVPPVLDQGAFGVALISGIWNGPDIKQESFEYMKFFGRR